MVHANIKCPMFKGWESGMNVLAAALNDSGGGGAKKARLAGKLRQEADSLLACRDYDGASQDCGNCRALASRRRFMAELVTKKTAKLVLFLAGTRELLDAPAAGAVKVPRAAE